MNSKLKNIILTPMNILYAISPKTELELLFRIKQGYKLNLKNPKTFNEKLQWMKLYWKSEVREQCSDKYMVRKYIEERCPETLTNLYWQGFDAKDIPFDRLPDKFVLKATHGSGFNIICRDKSKLDINETRKKLNGWLKEKYIRCYGEEFYGKIKPSIIVEEYLEGDTEQNLTDYKVMCFDGEPTYIWVVFDRYSEQGPQGVVLDLNWNVVENVYMSYPLRDRDKIPQKPNALSQLLNYARFISKGLPHVRVDMYMIEDRIVFGEMSFSHGAGLDKIKPYDFDKKLGDFFKLPK